MMLNENGISQAILISQSERGKTKGKSELENLYHIGR